MKDHYEVLGVRRSASQAEIELAYKGRRTQYHPDKYQSSDAETLQWATTKMQEVNAAYAVLSDAQQRARFDADARGPEASASKASSSAASPVPLKEFLRQNLAPYIGFSRTYFAPDIPPKKLSGALQSYGEHIKAEDVLVLIDSTIFGGAKEGALLTEQEIHLKELGSSHAEFYWRNVRTITSSGKEVYINGYQILDFPMVDAPELARLINALQKFVASTRQAESPPPPAPAPAPGSADRPQAESARSTSSAQLKHLHLLREAKANVIVLCKHVKSTEVTLGKDFIDRDNVAEYFAYLETCLHDPGSAESAAIELALIALLSHWAYALRASDESPPAVLCNERDDDSQLVDELRFLVCFMLDVREAQKQKARTDQFFGR